MTRTAEYKKDPLLINLLKGKRVALVGPAPYLEGRGKGDDLDTYDILCRVNEVIPEGLEKDYGSRTEIIFHALNNLSVPLFREQLKVSPKVTRGVRCIVCPRKTHHAGRRILGRFKNPFFTIFDNYKKLGCPQIPLHHIGDDYYDYIIANVLKGGDPNTGLLAMFLLLQYEPRELLITGFSFYSGKYRYNSAQVKQFGLVKQSYPVLCWPPGHPQDFQKAILRDKLLKEYSGVITIDSYIKEILNTDYSSVFDIGQLPE